MSCFCRIFCLQWPTKHVQNLIIKRHQSGKGCKRNTKAFTKASTIENHEGHQQVKNGAQRCYQEQDVSLKLMKGQDKKNPTATLKRAARISDKYWSLSACDNKSLIFYTFRGRAARQKRILTKKLK